jgi:hypothetical protein
MEPVTLVLRIHRSGRTKLFWTTYNGVKEEAMYNLFFRFLSSYGQLWIRNDLKWNLSEKLIKFDNFSTKMLNLKI